MRVLALLLLLGACATARETRVVPLGYTACAEDSVGIVKPFAFIRLDALASEESAPVVAHELSHMAVVRGFKSCREYQAFMDKDNNRARNEALAFCSQARTWARQAGVGLDEAVTKYSYWLAGGYPQHRLTQPEARALIAEQCT